MRPAEGVYVPDRGVGACQGAPFEVASRFVGTWQEFTVSDDQEVLEGTLTSSLELDGCLLVQRFSSVDGTSVFASFGYVDPETNNWLETYIFRNGRTTQWRWLDRGDQVIMEQVGSDGGVGRRLRVIHQSDQLYEVIEERMPEEGGVWEFVVLTRTRRVA